MKRLLREPLIQFLILGGALFGLHAAFAGREPEPPGKIVVTAAQVASQRETFARTWQRPPTQEELKGLVEDYVREEVYYREGKALGVDRDDIVIRRRIRQKMEFFAEDMAAAEPTDGELEAYLAAHPERFRTEESLSFRHVFLNAKRGNAVVADADGLAKSLAHADPADPALPGDGFLLGSEFNSVRRRDVARDFGEPFAERLFSLDEGRWQGPLSSPFGLHFILVTERSEGGMPPLAAVRAAVEREWANARRVGKLETFYGTLRDRYEIVVEALPEPEGMTGGRP